MTLRAANAEAKWMFSGGEEQVGYEKSQIDYRLTREFSPSVLNFGYVPTSMVCRAQGGCFGRNNVTQTKRLILLVLF